MTYLPKIHNTKKEIVFTGEEAMEKSLKEAIAAGIDEGVARRFKRRCEELIADGTWIILAIEKEKITHQIPHPFATMRMVYWGRKDLLERYQNGEEIIYYHDDGGIYQGISVGLVKRLYGCDKKNRYAIGKSHEILRGSRRYPTWRCPHCKRRNVYNNDETVEVCKRCKQEIPEHLRKHVVDDKLPKRLVNCSHMRHRHLELEQMIRYFRRKGILEEFLRGRIS